jgi:hypothetical protein
MNSPSREDREPLDIVVVVIVEVAVDSDAPSFVLRDVPQVTV